MELQEFKQGGIPRKNLKKYAFLYDSPVSNFISMIRRRKIKID